MRVSVTGSFSTGKTTLVEAISRRYGRQVKTIEEVGRRVVLEGFPLDRDTTVESCLRYIELQLEAERLAETNSESGEVQPSVVSDRSLLDLLAYIRVNNNSALLSCAEGMLTEIVWRESEYFDLYCFVPIEFEPIVDGTRETDEEYQREIGSEIQVLLNKFGFPVLEIRGSVDERILALERVMGLSR